ncbi:alpha-amylase family protein [Acidicapsa acidisoli]|uniref:enterotoxin n=1 Tax=Acidicapsa acidisoli TaxID=1615681 RepID=UPI0021E00082|nr:enterotoxin [Acidicapsa acidisoli]
MQRSWPILRLVLILASVDPAIAMTGVAQSSNFGDSGDPVVTLSERTGGSLENRQIAADWQIHDGHLVGLVIRDKSATASPGIHSVHLDGPFSIELKDIGVLQASDLTIHSAARVENLIPNPTASRYSDRLPGIAVHIALADSKGLFHADWALILRRDSHYIRQVLMITSENNALPIDDVCMIDARVAGAQGAGLVRGSPLVAGNFFLGFESPLSQSSVVGDHAVSELHSGAPIGAGQSARYSSVIGIAPQGQMRRAFLSYIERERAHPYRTFLHYNSWFDIGFFTPYTQEDALNRIHAIGEELNKKRGVVLDSYLFDDGWDDHNDLWKIRSDFKDGFEPLTSAAAEYGTAPGIWLSPWGGYGPPKQERLAAAKKAGYEIAHGGLALSDPRYYARFHDAVTEMVTKYGVNQFKLDGTGNAEEVVKGSPFSSDFDAAIHLIEDLRTLKPDLYINLTSGTYPSPFWLFYADSIWRGGDDTEFAGVGSSRERWITYRDADTYDEVVKAGRLFPLNSLMLHGIVYAQKAPHLSTDPDGDFRNEVRSYFGSGTQLQELYITPPLLSQANWDTLAEAAKWSRRNASTLVDTHWIGGDPRWLSVYGWAAWSPQKGILTLRNPSDRPQDFSVDISQAFELPMGSALHYSAHSPWTEDASQSSIDLAAGSLYRFHLAPFQVLTLEALPR